jgi:putative oxidoreductase
MVYLLSICQLALALVMLSAATGKILSGEHFGEVLRLSYVPKKLITPITILVPVMEFCLTLGLLLSTSRILPFIMLACAALFTIFTVWMFTVYFRGLQLQCGCFGTGGSKVGLGTITRNVFLIIMSLGGFFLALHAEILLPDPSLWMFIIVSSGCFIFMLLFAFQRGRKELVLTPR